MMFSKEKRKYTIAIIGGGCSGALVATHLLRASVDRPLRVVLIERVASRFSRGVAFGTDSVAHLLNVTADNMSAFAYDCDHFIRWAQKKSLGICAETFAQRKVYGDYLKEVLNEAEASASPDTKLERVFDDAVSVDVNESDGNIAIGLRDGGLLHAERLVLAPGNYPPANPPVAETEFYSSPLYISDPWSKESLDEIEPDNPVLLIGTGLTMVDVVLTLIANGHRAPIHALSRRGLLPQTHEQSRCRSSFQFNLKSPITLCKLLRAVREEIRIAATTGYNWQAVIDSLRSITPALWRLLSHDDQRRFLRHLRPYWEAHRHRMAPSLSYDIDELRAAGKLIIHTGRIRSYKKDKDCVEVILRRRGASEDTALRVGQIINCTGPDTNFKRINDPLIKHLRERGYIRPDKLGLGLDVARNGALINSKGEPSEVLYTIGSTRKASLWETNAVPEIRLQADELAWELISPLQGETHVQPFICHPQCLCCHTS